MHAVMNVVCPPAASMKPLLTMLTIYVCSVEEPLIKSLPFLTSLSKLHYQASDFPYYGLAEH